MQQFSLLFIIALLLIAFRALLAPLITLLPAALVLALASPVIAGATHLGVQVSAITQFILIVLVLGAGTDYGLFLVFRVREELRGGLEPKDAVRRAVATVGESITFSALIVMAALMSLIIAQFSFYQALGPALAIGIALMLIAGLTLLPALLAIFGRAVFWPSRARLDENPRANIYGRIAAFVVRRPMPVAVVGAIIFGAIAFGQLGTTTAGFADQSAPTGTDSAAGDTLISQHYGSANLNATEFLYKFNTPIWSHADDLQTIQTALQSGGGFATVEGPLTFSGQALTPAQLVAIHTHGSALAAAALARFVSPDGRTVQYIGVEPGGAAAPIKAIPALRTLADTSGAAVHTVAQGVFGIQPFAYDVNQLSSSDLWHIIPVVAVLIAILLAIVMRSLLAPLYLVTSVLLSYLAALGLHRVDLRPPRRSERYQLRAAVPHVRVPHGLGIRLQRARHDTNTRGVASPSDRGCGAQGDRRHRDHGHDRGAHPRRHVRGARVRRRRRVRRIPDSADRLRRGLRRGDGHLRGAHHPGSRDRGAAGTAQLVAVRPVATGRTGAHSRRDAAGARTDPTAPDDVSPLSN